MTASRFTAPPRAEASLVLARCWHTLGAAAWVLHVALLAPHLVAQCNTPWLPVQGSSVISGGFTTYVYACKLWDPDGAGPAPSAMVVGGRFSGTGSFVANGIAMFDPVSGTWSSMGSGVGGFPNNWVECLATLPNGDLVAGGDFGTAGGIVAYRIARWNGTTWSPLGNGLPSTVVELATLANGDLVASGQFGTAGGVVRWDGASWTPLGTGAIAVRALHALPNGDLLAGGVFSIAGGAPDFHIARWNGTTWSSLGTYGGAPFNWLAALATLPNGDLVAGGRFEWVGGTAANGLARWNGSSWSTLGLNLGASVESLLVLPNGDLLASGSLATASDDVARWNGTTWSLFGSTILGVGVYCLAAMENGDVFAGGSFPGVGGSAAPSVARLTTTCPATVAGVGVGCSGSAGSNALVATSLPWIGSQFRARATGMPAHGFAIAAYGTTPLSQPLAMVLPQALPGCDLLVSPYLLDLRSPVAGTADSAIALPSALSLVGRTFREQVIAIELDASSAILTSTSTNAITATIGAF